MQNFKLKNTGKTSGAVCYFLFIDIDTQYYLTITFLQSSTIQIWKF